MLIVNVVIIFFAKHSGNVLKLLTHYQKIGMSFYEWSLTHISNYLFQRNLSREIKLNPLGRYHYVSSSICYHNALRKFDTGKVYWFIGKTLRNDLQTWYDSNSWPCCHFLYHWAINPLWIILMVKIANCCLSQPM